MRRCRGIEISDYRTNIHEQRVSHSPMYHFPDFCYQSAREIVDCVKTCGHLKSFERSCVILAIAARNEPRIEQQQSERETMTMRYIVTKYDTLGGIMSRGPIVEATQVQEQIADAVNDIICEESGVVRIVVEQTTQPRSSSKKQRTRERELESPMEDDLEQVEEVLEEAPPAGRLTEVKDKRRDKNNESHSTNARDEGEDQLHSQLRNEYA